MKIHKKLLGTIVFALLVVSATSGLSVSALPGNLYVSFDVSTAPFHNDAGGLEANLTDAGSSFEYINSSDSFSIDDETDVLLFTDGNGAFPADKRSTVKDWFDSDGPKLLWMAGDSDYDSLWLPNGEESPNKLLEELGANTRFAADALEDSVASDGAGYRVVANQTHDDGDINGVLTEGIEASVFHGPTSILGYEGDSIVDLRNNTIDGVEVVMSTSQHAEADDQDGSITQFDYYRWQTPNTTGNYPIFTVQDMGDDKYIITTGEAIFVDYKNMYDTVTEYGLFNGTNHKGTHDGFDLVNNVFEWFGGFDVVDNRGFLPFNPVFLTIGIFAIPVIRRFRR